jgi:hypothetical protein
MSWAEEGTNSEPRFQEYLQINTLLVLDQTLDKPVLRIQNDYVRDSCSFEISSHRPNLFPLVG